jgi:hypothetical protein
MMKRSLGPKFFFPIFGTFGRYITNLRGTLVENVKKVENQPTLLLVPQRFSVPVVQVRKYSDHQLMNLVKEMVVQARGGGQNCHRFRNLRVLRLRKPDWWGLRIGLLQSFHKFKINLIQSMII